MTRRTFVAQTVAQADMAWVTPSQEELTPPDVVAAIRGSMEQLLTGLARLRELQDA